MAYLALAYPDIDQSDYDWIQDIRKMHDKRYFDVVQSHFTLVFSTDKLSLEDFTHHVKEKVKGFQTFNISLDSARVVEDDSKEFFHEFLIPSKGFDEINKIMTNYTQAYLLDVCSRAIELFDAESTKIEQKHYLLEFVLSNMTLEGETLHLTLKEPFDAVLRLAKTGKWYTRQDSNL